jgi:hypothetical protein
MISRYFLVPATLKSLPNFTGSSCLFPEFWGDSGAVIELFLTVQFEWFES